MAKTPPNSPSKGDTVKLRGRGDRTGVLVKLNEENKWSTVEWTDGKGPRICHLFELEKVV